VDASVMQALAQGFAVETGQLCGDLAGDGHEVLVARRGSGSHGRTPTSGGLVQQEADVQQVQDRLGFRPLLAFEVHDFGRVPQHEVVEGVFAGAAALPGRVEVAAGGTARAFVSARPPSRRSTIGRTGSPEPPCAPSRWRSSSGRPYRCSTRWRV
jgi:hypothetical protein